MSKYIGLTAFGLLLSFMGVQARGACTAEVYSATASLTGFAEVSQSIVGGGKPLKNVNLIEIALALNGTDTLPSTNMVLALLSSCQCATQTLSLVVWDKGASEIAATIATADDVLGNGEFLPSGVSGKNGTSLVLMSVENVGNFNGGYLALVIKYSVPTSGCISKATATLTGYINANAEDNAGTFIDGLELLFTSGTISAKSPALGTAVLE